MQRYLKLTLNPEEAFDRAKREKVIRAKLKLRENQTFREIPVKRSVDARTPPVKVHYETTVWVGEKAGSRYEFEYSWKNVSQAEEVYIIGCGPAGMFAALRLIELGKKPIILERGKDVRARRRDLAAINKDHLVNPDSNYCFGEGGAGTYSDGKLYTRSKKRGNVRRILEILHFHGSPHEILYDAHPHIGTNKLPKVVESIRTTILECGGEIRFNTRVSDILVENHEIKGIGLASGEILKCKELILATGHSARDIYELLNLRKIDIEAKPFAMGIRIEHPQSLIDSIQYKCSNRGEFLPAASYTLVNQTLFNEKQRGVFSFCMCPGGFIVPSATAPGEIVVNGMSPSKRNSLFANSGIVSAVEIEDMDVRKSFGELAGLQLQIELEQRAWELAGRTQRAPAQRMVDFVEGKFSDSLNDCSYVPGLSSVQLSDVLGDEMTHRLRSAFRAFGSKMKSYYTNEANLVGVESRSSAPVRIPRDKDTREHIRIKGLFPCGEGAGYAGGIVSAAMDGELVAESLVAKHA